MTDAELQEIEDIYQLLRKGLGHERVTDDNVAALIRRAERDDHGILATELREWQAPCRPQGSGKNVTGPPPGLQPPRR